MKTKKNFLIFFLLFLVGITPARGQRSYGKTIEINQNGQTISALDFLLHQGAGSPEVITRVKVKNGVEFFVQLPSGHSISDLGNGTLIGDRIKVSHAGSLRFEFSHGGTRNYVLAHVNYHGILQYQGSNAPATLDVTSSNEDQTLSVPSGKFPGIWWDGSIDGNNFTNIIDGQTTSSLSLKTLISEAKQKLEGYNGMLILRTEFNDGTQNGGIYSGSMSQVVRITDRRVVTTPPTITTTSLPNGKKGESYSATLQASGTAPITWSVASGNLPTGLSLSPDGRISGVPSIAGNFSFSVKASNAGGETQKPFNLTIDAKSYSVSLSAQPAEGGSVSGNGSFEENTSVTVSATPNSGWKFVKWTENGTQVSTSASYQFAISSNRNLVAVFEAKTILLASPKNFKLEKAYQRDAIISWTAGGSEKEWEVSYGDYKITVNQQKATLRGFTPNTEVTVQIRAKVGDELSEPLVGTFKTEEFTATANRIPHLYGMKESFTVGDILPIFWKDLEILPNTITYNLSNITSTTENTTKLFAPLPEAIRFTEKGLYVLTIKFEGNEFEEVSFQIEVK